LSLTIGVILFKVLKNASFKVVPEVLNRVQIW
jgi:hypothetical protein